MTDFTKLDPAEWHKVRTRDGRKVRILCVDHKGEWPIVLRGGLGKDGAPVAWEHRVVTQSILGQMGDVFISSMLPFWVPTSVKRGAASVAKWFLRTRDETSFEGAQTLPYAIPNLAVDLVSQEVAVPVGMWRSVGHSHTAFAVEGFADELAHAAGKDPYLFRRDLLAGAPRNRAVLDLVAEKSGWSRPPPAGVARGIAQHASFDSFAAAVAEVAVSRKEIAVRRVVIGIDFGRAVNPNLVRAQLESMASGRRHRSRALWRATPGPRTRAQRLCKTR